MKKTYLVSLRVLLPLRWGRALRSRPFAWLWAGQTCSVLGDAAFFVALVWQVLLLTNSATAIAIVAGAQVVPGVCFFLIGGVAADRLPRWLVLFCSDGGRAVLVLLLALQNWAHLLQFWHLVGLALLFGVVDGFFLPSSEAIRPQLVSKEDLPSANALMVLSQRVSLVVGPLIGTGLIAWTSTTGVFLFDGLTFVVSALSLLGLRASAVIAPARLSVTAGERDPGASSLPEMAPPLAYHFRFCSGETEYTSSTLTTESCFGGSKLNRSLG
jgi:hypothetical protein